jgi:hypothetical protein
VRHRLLRIPLEALVPSDSADIDEVHKAPAEIVDELIQDRTRAVDGDVGTGGVRETGPE